MPLGYDHLGLNQEILLDLLLEEGAGTNTQDWSKAHHLCTLTGAPTWQNLDSDLNYLNFVPGNPDYILSLQAATIDLNFISGDFSVATWIRTDSFGNRYLFNRGITLQAGWAFWMDTNRAMVLSTHQVGVDQHTYGADGDAVIGTWVSVGASRAGATVRIYANGVDTTAVPAAHVDPVGSAHNLYIGVTNALGGMWSGDMYRPRVWGRCLPASEFGLMFAMERDLFGI